MGQETILVTGAAGFIGYHLVHKLINDGVKVIGLDNLNSYYDPELKRMRLEQLKELSLFTFHESDITNYETLESIVKENKIDKICHLAAQAGVRYSIENPFTYDTNNVTGTLNILEIARHHNINDVVYASSSSVYGGITEVPFREDMQINKPISLYAATKAANELYAYTYHHLYGINSIGLRFFTVYGEYGRPDMAYFSFSEKILNNQPIKVFNHGNCQRDFTYVSDIVEGITSALSHVSELGYEVFNLGCSSPVNLLEFIETIEKHLDKEATKEFLPAQPGDVDATYADVSKANKLLGYEPKVLLDEGIKKFTTWYLEQYHSL